MFLHLCFISILSQLQIFFLTAGIVGGIVFFVVWILSFFSFLFETKKIWEELKIKKIVSLLLIICLMVIFIACIIPSAKMMLIGYVLDKISNSEIFEQTNELVQKSIKLLNQYLDNYLEEEKNENGN